MYQIFSFNLIVLIFFLYCGPSGRLDFEGKQSKIPVEPVLGGVRIVALSINSHEQTQ